jgi:hypothetical protein
VVRIVLILVGGYFGVGILALLLLAVVNTAIRLGLMTGPGRRGGSQAAAVEEKPDGATNVPAA